jgi:hypothetical protein
MTKQEWKIHHGLTTEEMEWITNAISTTAGTIVNLSPLPRDSQGKIIPFIDRRG